MGGLLFLFVLLTADISLASAFPGGEQFLLRWSGARAFLFERIEPYSTTVAQRVQQDVYGRPTRSGEYPYVLNDPFPIFLFYLPFALFPDFALVRSVWILLLQLTLVVSTLFTINLAEWQPPRFFSVLIFLFCFLNFYSVQALLAAAPAIFLVIVYAGVLLALRAEMDELAGALLALVAYQWEAGGLFFLFILFWTNSQKRWRMFAGLGMSLVILLAVSFLVYPNWGLPYLRAVLSDWYAGSYFSLGQIMRHWYPETGPRIGWAATSVLLILLMIEWFSTRRASFRHVVWTACLSLTTTPLIGVPIFLYNMVVLLLPFILIISLIWERWTRARAWMTAVILFFVLVTPWVLYARGILFNEAYREILSVAAPLSILLGLYWMRWWAVRSPRPWADQIGEYR